MSSRREALKVGRPRIPRRGRTVWLGAPVGLFLIVRGALGRHLSVRMKLTLWYGLMCAVTLGFLGYGLRLGLEWQTQSSIRSGLKSTADTMGMKLSRAPASGIALSPQEGFRRYATQVQQTLYQNSYLASTPGQFEQVILLYPRTDPRQPPLGACLVQSQVTNPCPFPPARDVRGAVLDDPFAVYRVVQSGQAEYVNAHQEGEVLRAYLMPISTPSELRRYGVVAVLEVFQLLHTYSDIESTLSLIALLAIPLGLLIALVVGWWIARAALRPINRISRTVRAIGESHDLSRRVSFVGPMDEVGRLAETFDHMMDRLEKVFETQKRFIADASHELRTPLTAIRGNADLLRIAPPEEREVCIASIRREAERMSRLVADLLLLAAADVEEQPVHMQTVDLCDVLSEVYRSALVMAGGKVSVSFEPAESVVVRADPDRIKQLVLNLVDNAVKFTPEGGSVLIGLEEELEGALITVSDSGIGIPPEAQAAIFERFFRVDTARSKRGSGLGLAISAWIVEAHEGTIEVHSEPGKGSSFVVHLPGGESVPERASHQAAGAT